MERVSKIQYYLDIAGTVATRSTCMRRCFGAIIVKNDSIVSTGLQRRAARTEKLHRHPDVRAGKNADPPG